MSFKAKAPASTANLGPGFDVLGLALDAMFDTVEVNLTRERVITIEVDGVESSLIPPDPEKNTSGLVASEFLKVYADDMGLDIHITKGVPQGVGLGSSGASAAATAFALNAVLGLNLPKNRLVELAASGEIASAGAAHADNVAPSLLGGFTVIHSYEPLEVVSFPPPDLTFALAVPTTLKKTTRNARAVIPKAIELRKMIQNLGSASTVVAGILLSDPTLVGKGMLGDAVVEPARAPLYTGYYRVRKMALEAGAEGVALSGAGPTMIAVVDTEKVNPHSVASAMRNAFESEGVACAAYVAKSTNGARPC